MANHDQSHNFYYFDDAINVIVTRTPSVIREWIRNVLARFPNRPLVVGVGVKWTRHDLVSGRYNYNAPADILQLCIGNQCLIIQLGYLDNVPDELRSFLTDEQRSYRFVGFDNPEDARNLSESRHRLEIRQLRDIRDRLLRPDVMSMSFQQLVEAYMGNGETRTVPERDPFINWSLNKLELSQILQASLEAYICYTIGVERCVFGPFE